MQKISFLFLLLFVNTIYSQVVVCYGTTKTYSVDTDSGASPNGTTGSTYSWSVKNSGGAVISIPTITATTTSGNSITINWGTTAVGNYSLEVIETNASCAGPVVTLLINIKGKPIVTTVDESICLGGSKSIIATASPSDPANDIFSWTSVPSGYSGVTNTNAINITSASTSMAGNYIVTVRDIDRCVSDPVTAVLTVNPLPDATIIPATITEFCAGGNVVLSAPAGLSYVWNKDGVTIPLQTAVGLTASLAGNYTVTTTDSNFCSSTTNPALSVVVNPNPTVTLAATATQFCDGTSATLTATPAAGTAPFTYQWENTSGNITTNGTNASYMATTTSDYKVKVTDSKGCNVTSTPQSIFNRPNPDSSISYLSPLTFCAGDNVILQRGTVPISGFTYQWIKDGIDIATTSTNFNYIAEESGSYKVRVVNTNYPTNCTTLTTGPGIIVNKTSLPLTTTITAH